MKKTILSLMVLLTFPTAHLLSVQKPIVLDLQGKLGGQPFQLNSAVEAANGGHYLSITRLQYYLSNFVIIHDGGTRTTLVDTYVLANPSEPSTYSLGAIECQNVEGIQFTVGIGSLYNHLDPSTYPTGHPLGHQNPSMHWGWSAGYRFVAIEGLGGGTSSNVNTIWQIHTVGDELTRNVTVMVNGQESMVNGQWSIVVPVRADYENVVAGIVVSQGIINHGSENEAITVMNNMQTKVFSAGAVTSVEEIEKSRNREIEKSRNRDVALVFPNPIRNSDVMNIQFDTPAHRTVVVRDVLGREFLTLVTDETLLTITSPSGSSGVYILSVECGGLINNETFVVQ